MAVQIIAMIDTIARKKQIVTPVMSSLFNVLSHCQKPPGTLFIVYPSAQLIFARCLKICFDLRLLVRRLICVRRPGGDDPLYFFCRKTSFYELAFELNVGS